MKYLCLIYSDERQWETMAREEYNAVMTEFLTFTARLRGSGKYVAGEGLQPTRTATTVRVRKGKISTTDGPFAETKEQLGGFYLIDATDLDDAIETAARIPSARYGAIEVRAVVDFSQADGSREGSRVL
jgi:hypothetical protein